MLGSVEPLRPWVGNLPLGSQLERGNIKLEWGDGQSELLGAGKKRTSPSPNQPDLLGHGGKHQAWIRSPWACVQVAATSWLGNPGFSHLYRCPSLYTGAFSALPENGWKIPLRLVCFSCSEVSSQQFAHTCPWTNKASPSSAGSQLPPTHHDHRQALTLCHMLSGQ